MHSSGIIHAYVACPVWFCVDCYTAVTLLYCAVLYRTLRGCLWYVLPVLHAVICSVPQSVLCCIVVQGLARTVCGRVQMYGVPLCAPPWCTVPTENVPMSKKCHRTFCGSPTQRSLFFYTGAILLRSTRTAYCTLLWSVVPTVLYCTLLSLLCRTVVCYYCTYRNVTLL